MIDITERPRDATAPGPRVPRVSLPSGWYDPDSSAFEPLSGAAAVNEAVARSIEADRRIEAPAIDEEPA